MPTHVVRTAGRRLGKGVLVTESAAEVGEYVTRICGGPDDMMVSVTPAGPPTTGGESSSSPRCQWCRRPGQVVFRTQVARDQIVLRNPTLCHTCAGLLGYGASGFGAKDQLVAESQEAVEAELAAVWRLHLDDEGAE